jgi:hypothetical protein
VKRSGWKGVERRMARDVGTERIPVTGERHGADFEDGIAVYQVKCRRVIPGWLWGWLEGIQGTGKGKGKAGCLVLKTPNQRDEDALVVVSWKHWVELHGTPKGEYTDVEMACKGCMGPCGRCHEQA